MSYLSRRDIEGLKPSIEKTVYKFLGTTDSSLVSAAFRCLDKGYGKRKTTDKLLTHLDSKNASKLADKLFDLVDDVLSHKRKRSRSKSKSREKNRSRYRSRERDDKKRRSRSRSINSKRAKVTSPKKERRNESSKEDFTPSVPPSVYSIPTGFITREDAAKANKIALLQAQIKSKISAGILTNVVVPTPILVNKPVPLILDADGNTVDRTGKAVILSRPTPVLKANLRTKTKPEFTTSKASEECEPLKFHDSRIQMKPATRGKRNLRFHEPGKFQRLGDQLRIKAHLETLQQEISEIAKKNNINSATKLALIAKPDTSTGEVPKVEWWDSIILEDDYDTVKDGKIVIKDHYISNLIEHPPQLRCPTDPLKPVLMPFFLTKKEQKKLRRQTRRENWREEQEKLRLGLIAPPEPKLRTSNLMRVLGTEAVQDPTKIEAHVKEQMEKRLKAHKDANAARQLTVDQKREKKIRKIKEDTTLAVHVAIFRINNLMQLAAKKFKIEMNAKQLHMTGGVLIYSDCCVVVVEGGPKQMKKYKHLMMSRIKWEEDLVRNPDGEEIPNKCVLVWEGTTQARNFREIKFKTCPTEKMAREYFKKHRVENYWDLAYTGAILDSNNTENV